MSSNYQSFSVVGINLRIVWLCRNRNFIRPVSKEYGTINQSGIKQKSEKLKKFPYGMENSVRNIREKKFRNANSYFEP